jgi:tripartite-type tricarboxylate transporter receptor subunit TctC
VPARCPRGGTLPRKRVGKIARLRAIGISVPGNFAHPTSGGQVSMKLMRALLAAALVLPAVPACAQFYKNKTLTLLVNYGVGGNADTEARIYQHYLPKYIAGNPTVITRNAPGAGGAAAMNLLGLNIASQPDGLTAGYFTTSATTSLTEDPVLRIKLYEFNAISAASGFNVVYARRDIVPGGMTRPGDIAKAKNVYAGGYARGTSHDTRLRLALEIMGLPYTMVTGFPGTAQINKAMLQNEVNFTGSSLPGYHTQVIPQIINPGVGMAVFQFPAIGPDGNPVGDPTLERAGIQTFDKVYAQAFGHPPASPKFDALLLMNDISTKLQRIVVLPKGAPAEAVEALRTAFNALGQDKDFVEDYMRVTGEEPDLIKADSIEPLFQRMRHVDPEVVRILKESVAE